MHVLLEKKTSIASNPLRARIAAACERIAPLWPLQSFVAVNPFLGLSSRHFLDVASLMRRVAHGDILMPASYYLDQIEAGRIQETDVRSAVKLARQTAPADWKSLIEATSLETLKEDLLSETPEPHASLVFTVADMIDAEHKTSWNSFIIDEISKWCSAYYDQAQSSWRMPWRDLELFEAWREAAQLDINPELIGLGSFRQFVATLPETPFQAATHVIEELAIPESLQVDFIHRQLMSIFGWSSHVQYRVREKAMSGHMDNSLMHLLAIRLVYDLALFRKFGGDTQFQRAWARQMVSADGASIDAFRGQTARYIAQYSLECAYHRKMAAQLLSAPTRSAATSTRRTLQAVFCIDVRSEVFRRSLESESDEIETFGFAGFFGLPIDYLRFGQTDGNARCPVLLKPKFIVREAILDGDATAESAALDRVRFKQLASGAWNSFKTSAISCFSFVETAGLWFGLKLAKEALSLGVSEIDSAGTRGQRTVGPQIEREICCLGEHKEESETGIILSDQVALAAGMLRNMGLTSNFAQLILICGHGSATRNNPYGAALDCGACGGHPGDVNARVATSILNKPAVRVGLRQLGIDIPADTLFLAGLHNTTTDEVLIFDTHAIPSAFRPALSQVRGWLDAASQNSRRERAASLGLRNISDSGLNGDIRRRSRDWAQVRPEWGLAGNSAFIAAPRERTRLKDLGGRTFLHSYDERQDDQSTILEQIMTAPMIVASWINLQYYASTVNNALFGSGNKVIHNVVGTFGIWQGNGGDLQVGLPLQSLHDGSKWVHEPLRLTVYLEAPRHAIDEIILNNKSVRDLFDNGWLHLFSIDRLEEKLWQYQGESTWQEYKISASAAPV